jgi:hypothetical protein
MTAAFDDQPHYLRTGAEPHAIFEHVGLFFEGGTGGLCADLVLEQRRGEQCFRVPFSSSQAPKVIESLLRGQGAIDPSGYAGTMTRLQWMIGNNRQEESEQQACNDTTIE